MSKSNRKRKRSVCIESVCIKLIDLCPELLALVASHIGDPCSWFAFRASCKKAESALGKRCTYSRRSRIYGKPFKWLQDNFGIPEHLVSPGGYANYRICCVSTLETRQLLYFFTNDRRSANVATIDQRLVNNFLNQEVHDRNGFPPCHPVLVSSWFVILFTPGKYSLIQWARNMALVQYSGPTLEEIANYVPYKKIARSDALVLAILWKLGKITSSWDDKFFNEHVGLDLFMKVALLFFENMYLYRTAPEKVKCDAEWIDSLPVTSKFHGPYRYCQLLHMFAALLPEDIPVLNIHLEFLRHRVYGHSDWSVLGSSKYKYTTDFGVPHQNMCIHVHRVLYQKTTNWLECVNALHKSTWAHNGDGMREDVKEMAVIAMYMYLVDPLAVVTEQKQRRKRRDPVSWDTRYVKPKIRFAGFK